MHFALNLAEGGVVDISHEQRASNKQHDRSIADRQREARSTNRSRNHKAYFNPENGAPPSSVFRGLMGSAKSPSASPSSSSTDTAVS